MKASAQARDRWRLDTAEGPKSPLAASERVDTAVSGTHAIATALRVGQELSSPQILPPLASESQGAEQLQRRLAQVEAALSELQNERDALQRCLQAALAAVQVAAAPTPTVELSRVVLRRADAHDYDGLGGELDVELADSHFMTGIEGSEVQGMFAATYRTLAPGTEVELQLVLSHGPLGLRGRVGWLREERPAHRQSPGMGIIFDSATPAAESALAGFPSRYYDVT